MDRCRRVAVLVAILLAALAVATPAATGAPEPQPTNVTCAPGGTSQMFCTWNAVANAPPTARFWLRMTKPEKTAWWSTTRTSWTFDRLVPDERYTFQLQYCANAFASCTKAVETSMTLPGETSTPTNFTCAPAEKDQMRCTWDPVADAPTEARYWLRIVKPVSERGDLFSMTGTSFVFGDLVPGRKYRFEVQYCEHLGTSCRPAVTTSARVPSDR